MKHFSETIEINNKSNTDMLITYLEGVIGDEMIMSSFIRDISIVQETSTELIIDTKSAKSLTFIQQNLMNQFVDAIKNVLNKDLTPKFVANSKGIVEYNKKNDIKDSYISKKFNFDEYVVSNFNSEVVKMSHKIVERPGYFSPLFITSSSGLGKTHLLHAIGNNFIEKGYKVRYMEPNLFTKKIRDAINEGGNKIEEYKDELKSMDVLLFDDIQNLGDRSVTLRVLFEIINHFIENEKQIVIVSDKQPSELSGFETRFITRFNSGLTGKINQPEINDLIKIIKFKLQKEKLSPEKWENEALNFIARNHSSSIRSIEGAIKRIVYYIDDGMQIKYTYQVVNNIFKDLEIDIAELTPNRIIHVVSSYYKIPKSAIIGKSRKKEIVFARQISIWIIRELLNIPLKEIGKIVGNRDHSTIMSSIKKIDYAMKANVAVKEAINSIETKIKTLN